MKAATDKTWSEKAVAKLKTLAAQDLSAQAIAEKLCAAGIYVSRNAVIGKCHRDGIALAQPPGSRPGARGLGRDPAPARLAPVSASVSPAPMPKARRAEAAGVQPTSARLPRQPSPARPVHPAALPPADAPPVPAASRRPDVAAGPLLLTAAQTWHCRYPVAGEKLSLMVCGTRALDGKPYCARCHRIAHDPSGRTLRAPVEAGVRRAPGNDVERDLVDEIGEAS